MENIKNLNGLLKIVFIMTAALFFSELSHAHAGPHGNDECIVTVGNVELRLNGYQFKGSNPDRHYCRHFPHLGQTIIKIDSVSTDLSEFAIELQLLKRNSWLGLVLNADDAFSVIKQQPLQYFSRQVVSIDSDIQSIDVYMINLRLHAPDGTITEQQFMFVVGFPFAQIMVGIAVILLLLIGFVSLRQLITKRQQQ